MKDKNEAIIKKVKGLLALANDNKDDEESQTAFILAQKLMFKHNIALKEIESQEGDNIGTGRVTVYKKLYWWERQLANIISKNFRVKCYLNNKRVKKSAHTKNAIIFLGFEKDVELAKEMYVLAYEALTFYSHRYVNAFYDTIQEQRTIKRTNQIKNSYMRGFLEGLNEKFEEQVQEMKQEYGLMVLVPKEVTKKFSELVKGSSSYTVPPIEQTKAYAKGFSEGNRIDYTKSTIDDDIIC